MVSPERAMTDLSPPELDVPNALSIRSALPGSTGISSISGHSSVGMVAEPVGTPGVVAPADDSAQFGTKVDASSEKGGVSLYRPVSRSSLVKFGARSVPGA